MMQIINTRYNDKRLTIFTTNYSDKRTSEKDTSELLEERIGVPLRSRASTRCARRWKLKPRIIANERMGEG